jgi:radical SAM protein with 4Fe4S-binding SPASM domain
LRYFFLETVLLLKTLSWHRVWNAMLLRLSYVGSLLFKMPYRWGLPEALSIEPSAHCNLHCTECPVGLNRLKRPQGEMSLQLFEKILAETSTTTAYLSLFLEGEPFLNPHLQEFIQKAKQHRQYVSISTNGHFLTPSVAENIVLSKLDKLIISVDGTTQEVYEQYRKGGDLSTVINGIKQLVKAKKKYHSITPLVEVQFLVFRHNEHQIDEIKYRSKQWGIDHLSIKTAQFYQPEQKTDFFPTIEKYSRYKDDGNGQVKIKSRLPNRCWRSWHSAVISWDGKILPCCFDKNGDFVMGTLESLSLKTIWTSKKYTEFYRTILRRRASIEMCRNCTEGLKK